MIELKVEEYCHDCPEFEAHCSKDAFLFADGRVAYSNIVISCEHAWRCAAIKKYNEGSKPKEESEEEPTTPDPITTADLCNRCAYYNCDYNCDVCHICGPTGRGGSCKCMFVEEGDPCPYFKEAKND